jgi:hypothetical protein
MNISGIVEGAFPVVRGGSPSCIIHPASLSVLGRIRMSPEHFKRNCLC